MAQITTTNRIAEAETTDADSSEPSQPFVGKWNELVSTTNWEKGQIVSDWRDALVAEGAATSEYSDEVWAQLVGGVTSQHVGRLRRVYQQFGESAKQYPGLFWSHFQAAIDWDDAEMWLEGAIQNGWSISQMRGKRWETVGKPGEKQPEEPAAELEGSLEDGQQLRSDQSNTEQAGSATSESLTPKSKELQAPGSETSPKGYSEKSGVNESEDEEDGLEEAPTATKTRRERLPVEVDDLPDDLAEAFEQFKLAIISHRREGWNETRCETVVECLDALKMLAEAPLD